MAESRCLCCTSPVRAEIDRRLAAGATNVAIADEYGMSRDSVRRHRDRHLAPAVRAAMTRHEARTGETAVNRLEALYERAEGILDAAEEQGQGALALSAVKELRATVELLARLTGELDTRPQVTVNLVQSPEWLALQGQILQALAPFPDARLALASSLAIEGEVVDDDE